jgi:hypothetical protein
VFEQGAIMEDATEGEAGLATLSIEDSSPLTDSNTLGVSAVDRRWAPLMFFASLISLVFFSGVLHLHDRPEFLPIFAICVAGSLAVYPLFVAELFSRWAARDPKWPRFVLFCLLPPLRLTCRSQDRTAVWFPKIGWTPVGPASFVAMQNRLSGPLFGVAMAVLPLIAVEFIYHERLSADARLDAVVRLGTAFVWLAFTVEFFTMISLTDRQTKYIRTNWLDLAIILMPLAMFAQAAQLGGILRLQQLSKLGRAYRLRGVAMRMFRVLLLMKATQKIMSPASEGRLSQLREEAIETAQKLEELQRQIAEIETVLAERKMARLGRVSEKHSEQSLVREAA